MGTFSLTPNLSLKTLSCTHCAFQNQILELNMFLGEPPVFFVFNPVTHASVWTKLHQPQWEEGLSHRTGGACLLKDEIKHTQLLRKFRLVNLAGQKDKSSNLLYLARFGRNAPTVHSLPSLYSWSFDFLCCSPATDRYLNTGKAECFHSCEHRVTPMGCRPHRGSTATRLVK